MKPPWKWFRKEKKSLTDSALKAFKEGKPASKYAKGLFKDETPESYQRRFKEAREKLGL